MKLCGDSWHSRHVALDRCPGLENLFLHTLSFVPSRLQTDFKRLLTKVRTNSKSYTTMGFRQGAILASCSFFLGVLFICYFVDHRILHQELTEEIIEDGFQFYTTFFNAPPAIKALLHGFMGFGILGLVAKLQKWDESAIFFDGSSLAAYIFAIAVYLTVTIPSLRTIVTPADVDTRGDRIEAMQILAAGNSIMMITLGAILVFQGGQEYARRAEARELASIAEEEQKAKKLASDGKDKKE